MLPRKNVLIRNLFAGGHDGYAACVSLDCRALRASSSRRTTRLESFRLSRFASAFSVALREAVARKLIRSCMHILSDKSKQVSNQK